MATSPNSKRAARPASELTTADIYGARHGIPEDIQAALQNVGRRNRQMVSMGRPLVPTQSLPAFTSPHFQHGASQSSPFMTERDTYARAESIINKEQWRNHEIQPYASTVDALDLAPSTRAELDRRLRFDPTGDNLWERGQKRGESPDTDTDVDTIPIGAASASMPPPPLPSTAASTADFPPVFASSNISQPELFSGMPPPPVPDHRATRALPRRGNFSKTVSAPVGRLGTWSGMEVDPASGFAGFNRPAPGASRLGAPAGAGAATGAAAGAAVGASGIVAAPFTSGFGGFSPAVSFAAPQEADEEDGFDVSEWAADEAF